MVNSNQSDQFLRTDHLTNSIGGRTARGGVVTFASHALKFVISIVATAVLARLLSPEDYGLIGMVAVVTNFVAMFKDLGLSHATVQRAEITTAQVSALFWINVSLSVGTMLLMVLIAPGVAWFYGDSRLTLVTVVTATGFILGGLSVQHEALLKRQMRFTALSVIAVASMLTGYAVGITLAWSGFSFWSLVLSQLAVLASNVILVWAYCGWRPGLPRRGSRVRSMVRFGGNVTGYATVNYFSKNADNLLIGKFWGAQPLGLYNKASQLIGLPTDQVNEPLAAITIPALSRLADSPERYRNAYRRIMQKVLLLVLPAVALILVASDWVILLILGPQWTNAGPILVFMAIAGLLQPVMSTAGWLLVSQGRGRDLLYWSLINAPISVLSIVAGLPWGALGVAAAYSVSRILVGNPVMFWFVGRKGPVRTNDFYKLLWPFIAASGAAILVCMAFRHFIHPNHAAIGVVICGVMILTVNILVLSLLPSGREVLCDVKDSILLLKPEKSDPHSITETQLPNATKTPTFLSDAINVSTAK